MKRCGSIFALFLMFFAVSCDNGSKFNYPNDKNSDAYRGGDADSEGADDDAEPSGREQGELYGECYPNKTCNEGLKCDVLNNICMKDTGDSGDTASDGDSNDTVPTDTGDTTPDSDTGDSGDTGAFCGNNIVEGDETCDGGTKECTALSSAFSGGYAVCRDDCRGWYSDNCISSQVVPDDDSWDPGNTDPTDTGDTTDPADTGDTDPTDTGDTTSIEEEICAEAGGTWDGTFCIEEPISDPVSPVLESIGNICTGQVRCSGDNEEDGSITCPSSENADFYGQDAYYASLGKCTPQIFTSTSKVVVDYNTGLIWEKSPSTDTYTWDNRAMHCNDLNSQNYAGKNNWRVPNSLELLTIVDNSTYNPAVNTAIFPDMPGDAFLWTSEQYSSDQGRLFGIYLGSIGYNSKTNAYKVLCVSGNEMPKGVFTIQTISGSVVVTDSTTGLMWQKEYTTGTWQQALKNCEDSTYAGYSDWRLPNKNELASLLNYDKPSAPYSDFPDMPGYGFWSSSTDVELLSSAWSVRFGSSYSYVDANNSKAGIYGYVRCVRDSGDTGDTGDTDPTDTGDTGDSGDSGDTGDTGDTAPADTLSLGNICTGQTNCYNASSSMTCPSSSSANFFGQDAQYTNKCTAQSFTASSKVVVDNNTGLTWEKSPSSSTYTWANRNTHCNDLNSSNYGGKSNWRVPNPLELLSIVNNSSYNPATNSNFTGMPTGTDAFLWTNNEFKGNTSYAYYFSSSYGSEYRREKTKTYKVLCVSGNEMEKGVFTSQTISGEVVVNDSTTGLMWQKEYVTKTWQQALKYCEDLSYAGYTDWRLPNKNEAASLLDYDKSMTSYSDFPDMLGSYFWSSSTFYFSHTYDAWGVAFYHGYVDRNTKGNNGTVRCVR